MLPCIGSSNFKKYSPHRAKIFHLWGKSSVFQFHSEALSEALLCRADTGSEPVLWVDFMFSCMYQFFEGIHSYRCSHILTTYFFLLFDGLLPPRRISSSCLRKGNDDHLERVISPPPWIHIVASSNYSLNWRVKDAKPLRFGAFFT